LRVRLSPGADAARVKAAVLRVAQAGGSSTLDPALVLVAGGAEPQAASEPLQRPAPRGTHGARPEVLSIEVVLRGLARQRHRGADGGRAYRDGSLQPGAWRVAPS
jgi:hypothetical protein